jgi:hypothetical protein
MGKLERAADLTARIVTTMTRDELTDRILELFPSLAEVEPWEWAETDDSEPVVMIEGHATFTGLDGGAVDLTAPIPNTAKIGVWRIEPSGQYTLKGLADDPIVTAVAKEARRN